MKGTMKLRGFLWQPAAATACYNHHSNIKLHHGCRRPDQTLPDRATLIPKYYSRCMEAVKSKKRSFSIEAKLQPSDSQIESTVRNLGNFDPCIWGDHFASYSLDHSVFEAYTSEIGELKEVIRGMLADATKKSIDEIHLIYNLHRLGISYHFEKEIDGVLEQLIVDLKFDDAHDYDLHTISMMFLVFRQHGYKIPCDVFQKFMDSNGKFKESLASDVRGLLSLYEASQLGLRGEDVLEEALIFTTTRLQRIEAHQSPHLAKQAARAMEQSFHKGIPRVEAREYISIYEEDEPHNALILRLAKLDFNLVQLMYQQELSLLSTWWKDVGLSSKFPYARDRVVESFLLTVAFCFEPRYSLARIILSKIIIIGPWIDDTYDAYGTFEELQLFTDAINSFNPYFGSIIMDIKEAASSFIDISFDFVERSANRASHLMAREVVSIWDISAANQLPDYMKFVCKSLFDLYEDIDKQMAKCGRSYAVSHSKEAMKDLCRAYYREAEWLKNNYIPSFDEYIEIAYRSNTLYLLITTVYVGIVDTVTPQTYEWVQKRPKIFKAAASIGRLQNDIVDIDQYDELRDRKASAVKCYKKQHDVSEKEAVDEIEKMIGDSWKDINEECLKPRAVQLPCVMPFLNFARIMDVIYKHEDGFSKPQVVKDMVTSLFVESIPV